MPPKQSSGNWKDDSLNPAGPAMKGKHVVRDDRAATTQKTQQEIIAEAVHLKKLTSASTEVPELLLTSEEDVAFFRQRNRQQLEENITRNYKQLNNFLRYAEWEEQQGDVVRARKIYEKAIPTHGMKPELWRHYAEFEVRCATSMDGVRAVFNRAVHALPQSDDLWLKYAATEIAAMDDDDVVRGIFREWIAVKGDRAESAWEEFIKFEACWVRESSPEVRSQRCRGLLSQYATSCNDVRSWLFYCTIEEEALGDVSRALEVTKIGLSALADPYADLGALFIQRGRLLGMMGKWEGEAGGRSTLEAAMSEAPTSDLRKALFHRFGDLETEYSDKGVVAEERLCLAKTQLGLRLCLTEDADVRSGDDRRPDCEYLSIWRRILLNEDDEGRLRQGGSGGSGTTSTSESSLSGLIDTLSTGAEAVPTSGGVWTQAVHQVYGAPPPLQIEQKKVSTISTRQGKGVALESAFEHAPMTELLGRLSECPTQLAALAVRFASSLLKQGLIEKARGVYASALKGCQGVAELWIASAKLEVTHQRVPEARALLEKARDYFKRVKDDRGLGLINDAYIGMEWVEYQDAVSRGLGAKDALARLQGLFTSCLREAPKDLNRWLQMIEVERAVGDFPRAAALLGKAQQALRPRGLQVGELVPTAIQANLDLLHRHAVQLKIAQSDFDGAIDMYVVRLREALTALGHHSLKAWSDAVSVTVHVGASTHAKMAVGLVSEYTTFLMRVLYGPAMLALSGKTTPEGEAFTEEAARSEGYARVRATLEKEVLELRTLLVSGLGRRDEEYVQAAMGPVVEAWKAFEREYGNDTSLSGVTSHPAVAGRKRGRLMDLAGAY